MAPTQPENNSKTERIGRAILGSSKPFVTIEDIAEELDVTPRTVRNHIDNVADDRKIGSRDVDRTTVYYSKGDTLRTERKWGTPHPRRQDLLGKRAKWHHTKAKYYKRFPFDLESEELSNRVWLYEAFFRYAKDCGGLKYDPWPDSDSDIRLDDHPHVTEDDVRYIDEEEVFFTAPWINEVLESEFRDSAQTEAEKYISEDGEVRGVSGLLWLDAAIDAVVEPLVDEAQEDLGKDSVLPSHLPESELDRVYPSAAEITHAGTIIDKFAVQLNDLGWDYE